MSDIAKRRVIVRRMNNQATLIALHQAKRRPGYRVGLTTAMIVESAKKALAERPGIPTVQAIAKDLGVAHNSICSRLKRDKTTIERELSKEFLSHLSRTMPPNADWKQYIQMLFSDASLECRKHPGLAHAIMASISQGPTFCTDFAESLLGILVSAGLSSEKAADQYDVVLACLCGMLVVQFPHPGDNPSQRAKDVAAELDRIEERRQPNLHAAAKALKAVASSKTFAEEAVPSVLREVMADMVVGSVEAASSARTAGRQIGTPRQTRPRRRSALPGNAS